jgi:hypothetical protein
MSTLRLIGAAAILSVIGTAPSLAQQVISEPGYCAFFYPNANCQNKGPGNPYTDPNYQRSHFATAGGYGDQTVVVTRKRHVRKPAGMY